MVEPAIMPSRETQTNGVSKEGNSQDALHTNTTTSVAIGVVTRCRPKSLIRLLESFTALSIDEGLTSQELVIYI